MVRFVRLCVFALLMLSVPAMAIELPKLSKNPAQQPSGLYKIDPNHTSVIWKISHMGISFFTARFDKVDGTLNFNAADPTKSVLDIKIPVASVSTGQPSFDKEIAGPKFLGGDKHPDMTFHSTSIKITGPDKGQVTGNLSLNGVTKSVILDVLFHGGAVHPMLGKHDIGFSATTTINRSDFNVTEYIPLVGDQVTIDIQTEFLEDKDNRNDN